MQAIDLFTGAYAFARKNGFLDTRLGSSLFTAAYFQYKKRLEDPFAGLIERYPDLFKGGHILDVGANIGYCSTLFARAIDPGRTVFAFEPEPFNVSLLHNVIEKRAPGVVIAVQAAVGARDGQVALQLNPRHHGDHRIATDAAAGSITVPLIAIDTFLEARAATVPVSFIKIDVQGYEQAVCEGATRTLAHNPNCTVVLEYMPSAMEALGFRPSDLLAFFHEQDYRAYVVHHDGSVTPGLSPDVGPRGYVDVLFSRRDIPA